MVSRGMVAPEMRCRCLVLLLGIGRLAACAAPPPTTPTPVPSAATTAPHRDDLGVDLTAAGVGSYQLTTIPVAVVYNRAAAHDALSLRIHFVVLDATDRPTSVDADLPRLPAGASAAVAARVELGGARGLASVSVDVGAWAPALPPASVRVDQVAYRCETAGCSGVGTVTGVLRGPGVAAGPLLITAVCLDGGGTVVGGGSQERTATAAPSLGVELPVIVNRPPAHCNLYVAPGV